MNLTDPPKTIYGVDFSGAKLAGRNIWIAACSPIRHGRIRLDSLECLESLCKSAERAIALAQLVRTIEASEDAVWGIDFPFGLPIEVVDGASTWRRQLGMVRECAGDAYALGLQCLERARGLGGQLHIRRDTDKQVKTPFDCYHYRIIYQTYHGMCDVLLPLSRSRGTAILPFHYKKLSGARRAVVEACPSSTLKRLGIPHQNYKQPAGGPLSRKRRGVRQRIILRLAELVDFNEAHRRVMMGNPGGDAIDAVVAAVGTWQAWNSADHSAILRHPRYVREGFIYA